MITGSNPILLNVTYQRPDKKRGIDGDVFEVTYKCDDGVPRKSVEPANVPIYFVKPEYRDFNYNKPQEKSSRLYEKIVPYSKIKYAIAEEIGDEGKKFIRHCYDNKDTKALDRLYGWPYSFGADFQPEFYFMRDWVKKYPVPDSIKLTCAFLDIEIDQIDYFWNAQDIGNTAIAPVNVATVVLDWTSEVFTFVLEPQKPSKMGYNEREYDIRYKHYEKQCRMHTELMDSLSEFEDGLNDEFSQKYGKMTYKLRVYSSEIELIADIFRLINKRKPNFCLSWNMRFDIQYLYYRIITLGYDPKEIMCHPDFENKRCYFREDNFSHEMSKQYDEFYCSSYTIYICQMRLYMSIRKSGHKPRSYALDVISDIELKDRKVKYDDVTDIRMFPYHDWKMFIRYNIKDSMLLMGIDRKTNDVMTYYMRMIANVTPYNKVFKETHLLRNVREMFFNEDGWVQANNINIIGMDDYELNSFERIESSDDDDDEREVSFKGAINADPVWNDHVGHEIMGKKSNVVFDNAGDLDMGGFYPSCKIFSNMDPATLIFKASFDIREFLDGTVRNRSLNIKYQEKDKFGNMRDNDITGEAVNAYVHGNILSVAYCWLGLPSIMALHEKLQTMKKGARS